MSMIRPIEQLKHLHKNLQKGSVARESVEIELRAALTASIPLDRLEAICAAEREGRCVVLDNDLVLAMNACAYAAEQHRRPMYCWDCFGDSKNIPYRVAAEKLRAIANGEQAEAAQNGGKQ